VFTTQKSNDTRKCTATLLFTMILRIITIIILVIMIIKTLHTAMMLCLPREDMRPHRARVFSNSVHVSVALIIAKKRAKLMTHTHTQTHTNTTPRKQISNDGEKTIRLLINHTSNKHTRERETEWMDSL
jgi:flagellar basal body-associated protein FliL